MLLITMLNFVLVSFLCFNEYFHNKRFIPLPQRPLKTIAIKSGDVYIPRGVSVPALDKDILWEFEPGKLGHYTQKSLVKK